MNEDIVARIEANPKYHDLVRKRNSFGITLSILMIIVYYGYILLIAFNKEWLATKIGAGIHQARRVGQEVQIMNHGEEGFLVRLALCFVRFLTCNSQSHS